MTIILQIVQTPSPVFFKSLRRCSRELGLVGDLVILGFSYRRVFIGEKVIGDLGNRGLGSVGELGLGLQSGTWACRGTGSIGDLVIGGVLLSGTWAIGDLGNRGLGLSGSWDWVYNRGLGPVGELGLSGILLSGSFYRGKGYRGLGLSG